MSWTGLGSTGEQNAEKYSEKCVLYRVEEKTEIFTKVEFHYMCSPQSLQAARHSSEAATQATENGETACLSVAK